MSGRATGSGLLRRARQRDLLFEQPGRKLRCPVDGEHPGDVPPAVRLMSTAAPPAWGVQYTLCLPTERAARTAGAVLARLGHRLTAVRVHDHFRFVPSSHWYGRPSTDPALEGWWQVLSLAVYAGRGRRALEPFLRLERMQAARVARENGGFWQGQSEGNAATLQRVFATDGLVHHNPAAVVPLPHPLPVDPGKPPAGPPWPRADIGAPASVVRAAAAVAERMYGNAEDAPDAVGWMLEEDFAFGEPYGTTGEFLGDLADAVAHQGTCTDSTVAAVPFLAELICDDGVPQGARIVLLGDLLRLAVTGPATAVSRADRTAALGGTWHGTEADRLTRHAIGRALPRLLSCWDDTGDAARFVLTALAAACVTRGLPSPTRQIELAEPTGSRRDDVLALVRALPEGKHTVNEALARVASWMPRLAEQAAGPHAAPRDLALAVLPELVVEDVSTAMHA